MEVMDLWSFPGTCRRPLCVLRLWGFRKTSVPYPVSQELDLLVERNLHFHGNFSAFPTRNSTSSVRPRVLPHSKLTTSKLLLWYHHFSICRSQSPRLQTGISLEITTTRVTQLQWGHSGATSVHVSHSGRRTAFPNPAPSDRFLH